MTARVVDGELRGFTIERLCAAVEWRLYLLRRASALRREARHHRCVQRILRNPNPPEPLDSAEVFAALQEAHPARPDYGYDLCATWRRAAVRVLQLLSECDLRTPGKRLLEVAAGDGMTGSQLSCYGHKVTLLDIEDWRDPRAREMPFLMADVCEGIPEEPRSFDVVYSYNAFEHFRDPSSAFSEIVRVCKRGGLILLSFGPLYWSPWGYHVYRVIRFPYPQMLFSESFVSAVVAERGIYDLGRTMVEPQYVHHWTANQFRRLWRRDDVEVVSERIDRNTGYLDLVERFPQAFRGRGLEVADIVSESIHVVLRKRS